MKNQFYTRLLSLAALFGIAGVAFGAFGAHFLKSRISSEDIDVLRTGVLYLFVHTVVLIAVAILGNNDKASRMLRSSGIFFVIGILLFSGSLFVIATRQLSGLELGYLGILTPIGGLCFMAGWLMLLLYSFSNRI